MFFTFHFYVDFEELQWGRTVVAIRAINSTAEPSTKAVYSLDNSAAKDLPALPSWLSHNFLKQNLDRLRK